MIRFFLTLALTISFLAGDSTACSCITTDPPNVELAGATAVFSGKVTALHDSYGFFRKLGDRIFGRSDKTPHDYYARYGFRVEIAVSGTWKGPSENAITVHTGRGGGDCGFSFVPGTEFLVYAYADPRGNLTTSICSRTTLWAVQPSISWLLARHVRLRRYARPNPSLQRTRFARR